MARLTIYKDSYVDSTVVSNCFIDEYMEDANDAQLKVYLYLIRMLNANQATSVSDIADKFNHTEKDVLRALKYWEKKQLLSLDFDEDRSLIGIHLRDLTRTEAGEAGTLSPLVSLSGPTHTISQTPAPAVLAGSVSGMSAAVMPGAVSGMSAAVMPGAVSGMTAAVMPGAVSGMPAPAVMQGSVSGMPAPAVMAAPVVFPMAGVMQEAKAVPACSKPEYSLDQVKEFKNRQETAQLLFIAETYIGRPLTPGDMKTILFFTDILGFSEDLIDYLIQYCVDRGKKDFKYIEKVAINWAEEGVVTPKQAQKFSSRYDKNVYTIMNELGRNTAPTNKEIEFITRWTKEYGFSNDIIIEACERTVLATDKHRFEYAEGILSSWKRENVHIKSDITKIDDLYQKRKAAAKPAVNNKFNQFSQNSYDFDALERELLSN